MIVGKIRVENFRGMSLGLYDENNRLHATAVTERADLQAICDGYNAFLALSVGCDTEQDDQDYKLTNGVWSETGENSGMRFPEASDIAGGEADSQQPPADQPRRGRGRPRKEVTEGGA